jgi:hypothetical protein
MEAEIKELISKIRNGDLSEKLGCLARLGDRLEYRDWQPDEFIAVVAMLISFFAAEPNWEVKGGIFRSLNIAFMRGYDLKNISMEPLIKSLANAEPKFVMSVLYILSMTGNKKYLPLMGKYLTHKNELIREEAQKSLQYLNK